MSTTWGMLYSLYLAITPLTRLTSPDCSLVVTFPVKTDGYQWSTVVFYIISKEHKTQKPRDFVPWKSSYLYLVKCCKELRTTAKVYLLILLPWVIYWLSVRSELYLYMVSSFYGNARVCQKHCHCCLFSLLKALCSKQCLLYLIWLQVQIKWVFLL